MVNGITGRDNCRGTRRAAARFDARRFPKPLVEARRRADAGAAGARDAGGGCERRGRGDQFGDGGTRARTLPIPASMRLVVRDTANSMETMLALGEVVGARPWFIASTVDASFRRPNSRGSLTSRGGTRECGDKSSAGVLASRNGAARPSHCSQKCHQMGLILALGNRRDFSRDGRILFPVDARSSTLPPTRAARDSTRSAASSR